MLSINSHLFELDAQCNYKHEFTTLNHTAIVPVGFIRTVYSDKFRRIWLLTNDDIKRVQNFDIPFEHLIYANEKNNFVRSLYYDEQNKLLLAGCYNGGIQAFDTTGNAIWKTALDGYTVKDISSIEKLSGTDYLIITIGRGLYDLNLPLKKLTSLSQRLTATKIDASSINFSNNVQRLSNNVILIATSTNIYECTFNKSVLLQAKPLVPDYLAGKDQINCFLCTSNKNLWVGTATGKIYRIGSKGVQVTEISGNYLLRSITEDELHNVWFGSDKGLFVYNEYGKLIKVFTVENGLLNDCIYGLLSVKQRPAVFASSNFGLSYVDLSGNIINYTKESGLQENEFNTQSAVKTLSDKYFFGGVNGITAFMLLHSPM